MFAERETKRTIILASTSGGSGGDAGAAQLLSGGGELGGAATAGAGSGPLDAAIVLGDLAGTRTRPPLVVPYSDGVGSAPLQLQRTVDAAIAQNVGVDPGAPSTLGQLAHLAFPLSVGEQGALDARGVPAVLVQASGERGPAERRDGERGTPRTVRSRRAERRRRARHGARRGAGDGNRPRAGAQDDARMGAAAARR